MKPTSEDCRSQTRSDSRDNEPTTNLHEEWSALSWLENSFREHLLRSLGMASETLPIARSSRISEHNSMTRCVEPRLIPSPKL